MNEIERKEMIEHIMLKISKLNDRQIKCVFAFILGLNKG